MELTSSYFRSFLAAIALESGDTTKALQITGTLSDDGSPYVFARIVFLYARAGARAKADSVFQAFMERDRAERFDPLAVTTAYAGYRDWDRVFETLNGALADQGWKRSLGGTRTLYEFNEIRDDPRYLRVLNAIGLK